MFGNVWSVKNPCNQQERERDRDRRGETRRLGHDRKRGEETHGLRCNIGQTLSDKRCPSSIFKWHIPDFPDVQLSIHLNIPQTFSLQHSSTQGREERPSCGLGWNFRYLWTHNARGIEQRTSWVSQELKNAQPRTVIATGTEIGTATGTATGIVGWKPQALQIESKHIEPLWHSEDRERDREKERAKDVCFHWIIHSFIEKWIAHIFTDAFQEKEKEREKVQLSFCREISHYCIYHSYNYRQSGLETMVKRGPFYQEKEREKAKARDLKRCLSYRLLSVTLTRPDFLILLKKGPACTQKQHQLKQRKARSSQDVFMWPVQKPDNDKHTAERGVRVHKIESIWTWNLQCSLWPQARKAREEESDSEEDSEEDSIPKVSHAAVRVKGCNSMCRCQVPDLFLGASWAVFIFRRPSQSKAWL